MRTFLKTISIGLPALLYMTISHADETFSHLAAVVMKLDGPACLIIGDTCSQLEPGQLLHYGSQLQVAGKITLVNLKDQSWHELPSGQYSFPPHPVNEPFAYQFAESPPLRTDKKDSSVSPTRTLSNSPSDDANIREAQRP